MKKIGIIGGLSPESTVSYYLYITRAYVDRFGDHNYPDILIYSVNLESYHRWRRENRWDLIAEDLSVTAKLLAKAGADFGLIATNTMHKVFAEVAAAVSLPLINLIEETAGYALTRNLKTLGLLGTSYTMSDGFYQHHLSQSGLQTLTPPKEEQQQVHRIIVEELIRGQLLPDSKKRYLEIIDHLQQQGAEGIILGCTEIPLLIKQEDVALPLLDTAEIHAEAALQMALSAD